MELLVPVFRRACPDPEGRQVNLPSILVHVSVGLGYYTMIDVLLSAAINRPMNFRYDTTTLPEVEEPIFNLTKGLGVRWAYGVPDKLVILLARMNGLLEDFGSNVDPLTIKQLEMEIEAIEAFVVPSADHNLDVGILAVQECWRQAAYIYLYMVSLPLYVVSY
jgi:hypothetical protein